MAVTYVNLTLRTATSQLNLPANIKKVKKLSEQSLLIVFVQYFGRFQLFCLNFKLNQFTCLSQKHITKDYNQITNGMIY